MGYRFRLHVKTLPGKPDIVLPRYKTVIFVHGCFWHNHNCAEGLRVPKSNVEYWTQKIERNVSRDKKTIKNLEDNGWNVFIVWECMTHEQQNLQNIFANFFKLRNIIE